MSVHYWNTLQTVWLGNDKIYQAESNFSELLLVLHGILLSFSYEYYSVALKKALHIISDSKPKDGTNAKYSRESLLKNKALISAEPPKRGKSINLELIEIPTLIQSRPGI